MTNVMSSCCICSQIEGNPTNDLISRSLGEQRYIRRVALETDSFALLPSIGPIVRGHSLVCPKRHVRSTAQLRSQEALELRGFLSAAVGLVQNLSLAAVHIFEHGSARNHSRTACTVDHAHLHLLPADVDIVARLLSEMPCQPVGSSLEELAARIGHDEYLYYRAPSGESFVVTSPNVPLESQYLRRVFAEALGVNREWNWRRDFALEDVEATYRGLTQCVSNNPSAKPGAFRRGPLKGI